MGQMMNTNSTSKWSNIIKSAMTTGIGKIILYKVTGGKYKVPLIILYIVVSFKKLRRCDNDVSSNCCNIHSPYPIILNKLYKQIFALTLVLECLCLYKGPITDTHVLSVDVCR